MLKKDVVRYFLTNTGLDVDVKSADEIGRTHLNYSNLRNVLTIFKIWENYIDTSQHKSQFLSTLLNDLNTLGCCAVSGNPYSPCYLGKQAHFDPPSSISITKYTCCHLKGTHIKQHLTSLIPQK